MSIGGAAGLAAFAALAEEGGTLDGGDGNDTINGFGGNDSISDGNGDDTIDGGDGDDWFTFLGFDGSETVNGGATTGVPSGLLKSTYFRGPHRGPPVATVFRMLRSS